MQEQEQKQEAQKECVVTVNADPKEGPLDAASAMVNVAKFVFEKDGKRFSQEQLTGTIRASYELGTVSISIPSERIMLVARLDEMMQVMFASAGAYRKLAEQNKTDKEKNNND